MSRLGGYNLLKFLAVIGGFLGICEAKTDAHRFRYHCPICDDYDLESDPSGKDLTDVLKELDLRRRKFIALMQVMHYDDDAGYKDENIKQIQESKDAKLDIRHDRREDVYHLITSTECRKDNKNVFELKKEFTVKLCDGREIPSTITSEVDEDREKIELTMTFKGLKGHMIMEFVEGGMLLHIQANGKKATLKFRVSDRNVITAKPSGRK